MIQIKIDGYCQGCPNIDLDTSTNQYYSDDNADPVYVTNEVYCTHEKACERVFWIGRASQEKQFQ